jgi:hypothetical protein
VEINILIYDVVGKLLYASKSTAVTGLNIAEVDISDLRAGMYYLSVAVGAEKIVLKIVKD